MPSSLFDYPPCDEIQATMPTKILVVDDEPDLETLVRQKFRRKIREGELDFSFALNGQEALDKLQNDVDINIVMSDINMPVMDGLTLLSRVGGLDRLVKTVIVSAYGDLQNIRIAMNRGAFDFLTKPIDFDDFEITIQKTIAEIAAFQKGLRAREELTVLQYELNVASRIQQGILPCKFPPFPDRTDFEIYAAMHAARSVGGDFFDFFFLDKSRLGFVIGDVSGKGIPAAIFMAVSGTLLRATALQAASAGECIQYVNGVLNKQSDGTMFVTLFYGILHTSTGELEYCIGGHNPPYFFSREGEIRPLSEPSGIVVGIVDGAQYETGRTQMQPGDAILLYTDGVTEANNSHQDEFSEDRVVDWVRRNSAAPMEQVVNGLIAEVKAFAHDAPQSDDITALSLRYLG